MRSYIIRIGKDAFSGNAEQVCEQMRDSSMFEKDVPVAEYICNVASRHKKLNWGELDCSSFEAFVNAVAVSNMVDEAIISNVPKTKLTGADKAFREYLLDRFACLQLGWFVGIDRIDSSSLEDMVDELEAMKKKGDLDIETEQGLVNFSEITERYLKGVK